MPCQDPETVMCALQALLEQPDAAEGQAAAAAPRASPSSAAASQARPSLRWSCQVYADVPVMRMHECLIRLLRKLPWLS